MGRIHGVADLDGLAGMGLGGSGKRRADGGEFRSNAGEGFCR